MPIITFVDHTIPVAADFNDSYSFVNTEVRTFERGGTGLSSYTKGDLIYASATDTTAKLPISVYGAGLGVSSSNLPAWSRTLFKSGTNVGPTNGTTSVFSGGSFTVVGGTMGTTNRLRTTVNALVTNNSGGALTFDYSLQFSGSTQLLNSESFANGTTNGIYNATIDFVADNATNAQLAISRVILLGTSTKFSVVTYAANSAADATFNVTLACAASATYTVRYAMVEVVI